MKLHLDENFDNVQVEVQAVADPIFVAANEEHDENKKKYEAAMEANEEATEGLTPEEGESIEVEKREVLKQMHLEESLFTEEVEDDKKDLYDAYLIAIREEQNNSNSDMSPYSVLKTLRDKRTGWDSFVEDWASDFNLDIEDARVVMISALDAFLDGNLNEDFNGDIQLSDEQKRKAVDVLDIDLSDDQKERAYDALEMAEIVDNDIDADGNHIYDKGNLMSQEWTLVKRTEGDIEDYPYTLMINDWAWDDITPYGFKKIVGELEEDFKKGDKFKNKNSATIEILDADNDFVTYEIKAKGDYIGDGHITDPKSVETVIRMNGYEKISESMEEIDRQVFGSLNKETREPGVYYVLVDQNFDRKIYADSDEEAIEKFRAQLNEEYDSRIGGDTEDFAADLNDIRNALKDIELATPRAEECMSDIIEQIEFYENQYLDPDDIQDLKRFRESIADKYNTNQAKDINVDNIDIYIRKLRGDKNLNGLTKSDREHIASYLAELRDEIKSVKLINESLETSDFEERKENARLMHEVMIAMNDEEAYFTWIYVMPDEPDEYDFEWFAEEDAEYTDLCMEFDNIYNKYGKEGLFDPSDEVVNFLEDNNYEVNIIRPKVDEEYDPDLGGDIEDYKLDKDALNESESFPLNDSDKLDVREDIINTLLDAETTKAEALEILASATEEIQSIDEDVFLYPSDERYEEVYESLIYNVAKEQLKRFTEGKMGDSWNPKTYLERLESKKYLNEEQIKKLNESVSMQTIQGYRNRINDLKSIDDIKEYCDQYKELFYVNNGEDELQIFMTDALGDDNFITSVKYSDFE